MNRRYLIFTIVLLLLGGMQAFIGGLDSSLIGSLDDQNYLKSYLTVLNQWKLIFVILLAIAVPLFTLQKEYFGPKQVKAAMKRAVMETIVSDVFEGDKVNTRITIFKACGWFQLCFMLLRQSIRHPIMWYRTGKRSLPKFGKYLRVSTRIGTENERSTIYFYYSSKTSKDCQCKRPAVSAS